MGLKSLKRANGATTQRKPRKLRSRTWKVEGYNEREPLASTAIDFVRSLRISDSGKTLEWGCQFGKDPGDCEGPAVKQRLTVTIEDVE